MRMSKIDPWFGAGVAALTSIVLAATFSAFSSFNSYRELQDRALVETAVLSPTEAFEKAAKLCNTEVPSERTRCLFEFEASQKSEVRAQHDLIAQQEMSRWSFGVLLIGLFSAFFSAGGLIALVWTFRETRKMTQAQDRAYVTICDGVIHLDPTYGLIYRLEVHNSGNTPATFVQAQLSLTIDSPDKNDRTVGVSTTFNIVDELNEVPAKAGGTFVSGHIEEVLSLPDGLTMSHGSHYRKTGTIVQEDGDDTFLARIEVSGVVVYYDVFDGQHTPQVRQYSMSLEDDGWRLRDQNVFSRFGV